jgi:hypothetical protein
MLCKRLICVQEPLIFFLHGLSHIFIFHPIYFHKILLSGFHLLYLFRFPQYTLVIINKHTLIITVVIPAFTSNNYFPFPLLNIYLNSGVGDKLVNNFVYKYIDMCKIHFIEDDTDKLYYVNLEILNRTIAKVLSM